MRTLRGSGLRTLWKLDVRRTAALLLGGWLCACSANDTNAVYKPGPDISVPQVIKKQLPLCPETLAAGGTVWLEVVVRPNGRSGSILVIKSLGREQDNAAIEAVSQWDFTPGIRRGTPVNVRITVEIAFDHESAPPNVDH